MKLLAIMAAGAIAAGELKAGDVDISALESAERKANRLYQEADAEATATLMSSKSGFFETMEAQDRANDLRKLRNEIRDAISELE
jgi:hypothetical protein